MKLHFSEVLKLYRILKYLQMDFSSEFWNIAHLLHLREPVTPDENILLIYSANIHWISTLF